MGIQSKSYPHTRNALSNHTADLCFEKDEHYYLTLLLVLRT